MAIKYCQWYMWAGRIIHEGRTRENPPWIRVDSASITL